MAMYVFPSIPIPWWLTIWGSPPPRISVLLPSAYGNLKVAVAWHGRDPSLPLLHIPQMSALGHSASQSNWQPCLQYLQAWRHSLNLRDIPICQRLPGTDIAWGHWSDDGVGWWERFRLFSPFTCLFEAARTADVGVMQFLPPVVSSPVQS